MARRIEIELTSARPDGSWTWRAAGALKPRGALDGTLLYDGAKAGDVVRADADFEVEGITIVAVLPPREKKRAEPDRLEVIGPPRAATPGVTTSLTSHGSRDGGDGPPRGPRRSGEGGPGGDRNGRSQTLRGARSGPERTGRPPSERTGRGPAGGGARPGDEGTDRPGWQRSGQPGSERGGRPAGSGRPGAGSGRPGDRTGGAGGGPAGAGERAGAAGPGSEGPDGGALGASGGPGGEGGLAGGGGKGGAGGRSGGGRSDRAARPWGGGRPDAPGRPGSGGGRQDGGGQPGRETHSPRPAAGRDRRSFRTDGVPPGAAETEGDRRPRVKRLSPANTHRAAALEALPPEHRPIAEQVLRGGIPAVRTAIHLEKEKAAAEGRPAPNSEALLQIAEDLLPRLKAAEWRDRAEAAEKMGDDLSLRDLRSVVDSANTARDDESRHLAAKLREALEQRAEALRVAWLDEIRSNLTETRLVRALRVSSRPPDPATRLPADLATQLAQAAGAAMAADTPPDRWAALLEAVAASPIRRAVKPAGLPAEPGGPLLQAARQQSGRVPALAAMLGISMPPPPGPIRRASSPTP